MPGYVGDRIAAVAGHAQSFANPRARRRVRPFGTHAAAGVVRYGYGAVSVWSMPLAEAVVVLPSTVLVAVAVLRMLSSDKKPEPAYAVVWLFLPLLVAVALLSVFLSAPKPTPASATVVLAAPSLVAVAVLSVLSTPSTLALAHVVLSAPVLVAVATLPLSLAPR